MVQDDLNGDDRPRRGQATDTEGGEDSIGVDGVGAVVSRAEFAEVRRCLSSRHRWPPRVEAEVKEDAPGHGVIGDEGDDLEPAAAVGACEAIHGEDVLQQVGPGEAVRASPGVRLRLGLGLSVPPRPGGRAGRWVARTAHSHSIEPLLDAGDAGPERLDPQLVLDVYLEVRGGLRPVALGLAVLAHHGHRALKHDRHGFVVRLMSSVSPRGGRYGFQFPRSGSLNQPDGGCACPKATGMTAARRPA